MTMFSGILIGFILAYASVILIAYIYKKKKEKELKKKVVKNGK